MELSPGYKQTDAGVIPEDWNVTPVGQAFDICNNLRMPISQSVREKMTGPFPYYGPTSVQGYINEYRVEGKYALIGEDGDHFLKWQDQPMTQLVSGRFNVNNHAHLVKGTKNATSWFYYYFSHRDLTPYLTRQGAGRYKLTKTTLIEIPCALPPTKTEQEAIAEALSDACTLIESLKYLIAKKRQVKQGSMQELLTGKKRLPGFSGQWTTRQLGEVIAHCSSGATPYRARPEYYKGTVKWITSGELNYNCINDTLEHISEEAADKTNLKVHPVGTFLMAITGLEAAGTRGACGIVGSPATTNQSCMAIYPSPELKSQYLYHYYVLRGSELALRYCQGTKQQSYTARLIRLLPIDLPPSVEEQAAIAAFLSDMDAEIGALESKLAKTRQLKHGMMQELLTGRVRLV